ncbi:unnamed protein product [Symbiodinium pilosum]|uniref:Uncharacterized protein n=1 Tax=Symbiodinium pilosum TaxID=2952 RepID=A0A812MYV6_SYMPI|nr:unnamed protein product [Symbiodinium pilosum]
MMSLYRDAIKKIKDHFPGIDKEGPPKIGDGGTQAPFEPKMAKAALSDWAGEYRCANNILKCDLEFNADPNVPLRGSAVGDIMKYSYSEPALFAEPFEVHKCSTLNP